MVGSAIVRKLMKCTDVDVIVAERDELDLCDQNRVHSFFKNERPDEVILAAAKVGGIHSNSTYPAEFIYQNLQIQNNVINSSHIFDVQKLLFLGSSCIYPKNTKQPIKESSLLSGHLEVTNEPYAIAKIAGIKMCESYNRQYGRDYRSVMPTNLYGPGDNYHPLNSHVIPGLIQRFHFSKKMNCKDVSIWGTGNPKREFMYVDDMAEASILVHNLDKEEYLFYTQPTLSHINLGSGMEVSIKELAYLIKDVVGFRGNIVFNENYPDGPEQKLLDSKILHDIGFVALTSLHDGLQQTYENFKNFSQRGV